MYLIAPLCELCHEDDVLVPASFQLEIIQQKWMCKVASKNKSKNYKKVPLLNLIQICSKVKSAFLKLKKKKKARFSKNITLILIL